MKADHIANIRAFNRFYTRVLGLLDKYILNSQYTLPEVRILYELATMKILQQAILLRPFILIKVISAA